MDADQVNTLGGFCELIGVGFVARDLMTLARYRGKLAELVARFHAWRAAAVTVMRKLLRRPRPVVCHIGLGGELSAASRVSASATGMRGPFARRPSQSLQDQVEELGLLVNRLREEVIREPQERERAISAERRARREELRAEAEQLGARLGALRQEFEDHREVTTGGLGLRVESVGFLVVGILFTVWPDDFARWLPVWPPFPVAVFLIGAYLVARFSWAQWLRPREDQADARRPRVGCGVLWYGRSRQPRSYSGGRSGSVMLSWEGVEPAAISVTCRVSLGNTVEIQWRSAGLRACFRALADSGSCPRCDLIPAPTSADPASPTP